MIMAGVMLLVVAAGFFRSLPQSWVHQDPNHHGPIGEDLSSSHSYPVMDNPGNNNGQLVWFPQHHCLDGKIYHSSENINVSFIPSKPLKVHQRTVLNHGSRQIHVQGEVVFRRLTDNTLGPSINVDIATNDPSIDIATEWDPEFQNLRLTVPRGDPYGPCVNIAITVDVPPDGVLSRLEVYTDQLAIKLMDDLALEITQQSIFGTVTGRITCSLDAETRFVSGHVSSSDDDDDDHDHDHDGDDMFVPDPAPDSFHFNSRIIQAHTISGSIRGAWPLYDFLKLQSVSGAIKVYAEPKRAADGDEPAKPAILSVESESGKVHVVEPAGADRVPPRDYRVDMQTRSGHILATVAFSSQATVRSVSGSVGLTALPVLDASLAPGAAGGHGRPRAGLSTRSVSGLSVVRVRKPVWVDLTAAAGDGGGAAAAKWMPPMDGVALRCLDSEHESVSGKIMVRLDASWEGAMRLQSLSGTLKAEGRDVKVVGSGNRWPKWLTARKGGAAEEGSRVLAKSTSGSVYVDVGAV